MVYENWHLSGLRGQRAEGRNKNERGEEETGRDADGEWGEGVENKWEKRSDTQIIRGSTGLEISTHHLHKEGGLARWWGNLLFPPAMVMGKLT